MTRQELRDMLAALRLSVRGLARLTGYSPGAAQGWMEGFSQVPEKVAKWLRAEVRHRQAYPPPRRERNENKAVDDSP
jgi:hypothetical protein